MIRNLKNLPDYIIVDDLEDDAKNLTPEKQAYWHNVILKNMKKKIYIAGKVTGEPFHKTVLKFANAKRKIEALGFEAVNPIDVVNDVNADWQEAMKICIKALIDCDGVMLLPDYINSRGATIERDLAKGIEIPAFHDLNRFVELWNK